MITIDFETYSEAGYILQDGGTWKAAVTGKPGLKGTGAAAYAQHPSTRVVCLAYGDTLWTPGQPNPQELFDHIANGGAVEAHNAIFEWFVWQYCCVRKYGWPELPLGVLRCSMAKAQAYALPGALDAIGSILNAEEEKDDAGKRLIRKLSVPKRVTKKDPRWMYNPVEDKADYEEFYKYCRQDVRAEEDISARLPELSPYEMRVWQMHMEINTRGVHVDTASINRLIDIYNEVIEQQTQRLRGITDGEVQSVGQLQKMQHWLSNAHGVQCASLTKGVVSDLLTNADLPAHARQVLEIRQMCSRASAKKLFSLKHHVCSDGRVRDLYAYMGAERTGRFAGRGPQPQNLPSGGPDVVSCCGVSGAHHTACPQCGAKPKPMPWGAEPAAAFLRDIHRRNVQDLEHLWGDVVQAISGSLRSLFMAAPGYELVCSDYDSIEAVVLAVIAREQWRLDVFNSHGMIYEECASRITGIPVAEFVRHKKETGAHLPERKTYGKIPELASGYQGSIGAWKAFGADKYMTDEEILDNVKAWRRESPNIVNLWYGIERAARNAMATPNTEFAYNGIAYMHGGGRLYCRLPSGRYLTYHNCRIGSDRGIVYDSWYHGSMTETQTYGGKLTENVVQAAARDLMVNGMLNVHHTGHPIVLHVHDEPVSEVPEGTGDIEQYERLLGITPAGWAAGWPVRASGGWRGKRYRK